MTKLYSSNLAVSTISKFRNIHSEGKRKLVGGQYTEKVFCGGAKYVTLINQSAVTCYGRRKSSREQREQKF